MKKEKNFLVQIEQFEILVQENDLMKDIQSMHLQEILIKQSLNQNQQLREQVLYHLTTNFYKNLTLNKKEEINEYKSQSDWNVDAFRQSEIKLLLHLRLN